jgi:hypothetical protein
VIVAGLNVGLVARAPGANAVPGDVIRDHLASEQRLIIKSQEIICVAVSRLKII